MTAEIKENLEPLNQEIELVRNHILKGKKLSPDTIESVKKAKIKKISDNIYSYSTDGKNIKNFLNKKGDGYFSSLEVQRTSPVFNAICKTMDIIEKDNGGVFELYRIERTKNGSLIERKIDSYSIEYFNIWKDVEFYNIFSLGKAGSDNNERIDKTREHLDYLVEDGIASGALRIKEFLKLLKHGEVRQEKYKIVIKKLGEILPQQCLDIRFDKIGDSITSNPKTGKGELEIYLKEGYITKEIYDKCIINLKRKEKEMNEIHSQTKAEVSEIQVG